MRSQVGRRVAEGFLASAALALWLIWTNPCDRDLMIIRFYVTAQDSSGGAWMVEAPIYEVTATDTLWRSHPCAPDSVRFQGPCRSTAVHYAVVATALDTTGRNESGPSNDGIPVDFMVPP